MVQSSRLLQIARHKASLVPTPGDCAVSWCIVVARHNSFAKSLPIVVTSMATPPVLLNDGCHLQSGTSDAVRGRGSPYHSLGWVQRTPR